MLHVRTTKTASSSTAVQVMRYEGKSTIVVKHIGSAQTKEDILLLKAAAYQFIKEKVMATGQRELISESKTPTGKILQLDKCEYLGARHNFIYDLLIHITSQFGFDKLNYQLLLDLVIMRIIEPSSKLQAIFLLHQLFDISYSQRDLYRKIRQFPVLKERVKEVVVAFAKKHYSFDFSMVFYDVTTLYYESFNEDEDTIDEEGNVIEKGLRKGGLGKEIKIGQPIIVIGLMVTKEGFPVSYEVYEGNTFEGDTFIPSILSFKKKYNIQTFTIVADAAMISFDNVEKLKEQKLSYIVGARIANLKRAEMRQVSDTLLSEAKTEVELVKRDGQTCRIQTERGLLLCDFSLKRYKKDKREMEKQIQKAKFLVEKNSEGKRTKFLQLKQAKNEKGEKQKKEKNYELNAKLIEQATLLLGIKGYYTNLFEKDENLTDRGIIAHYHSLWHVEKAFRIAKSDLAMRPIYHYKRQAIEAHILICFMALSICKHMELKTQRSTKKIVGLLRSITTAQIKNLLTGEIIFLKQELSAEVKALQEALA